MTTHWSRHQSPWQSKPRRRTRCSTRQQLRDLQGPRRTQSSHFSQDPSNWEPARPVQRSRGPLGPECRKILKMSPGASGPGTPKNLQKVPGHSKITLETLSGDSPETSRTVTETFLRLFGVPWPEPPQDIFETFSALPARRA